MSGDEPYRWNQGLMLTPDQYVKLGMAMQALGPRVTELANEPLALEHRQLTEQELSDLTGAISEADREQVTPPVSYRRDLDLASPELENFRQVWDMSNEAELTRVEQDAQPLPRLAEDRMAYLVDRAANRTLVPQGPAAYGLARRAIPRGHLQLAGRPVHRAGAEAADGADRGQALGRQQRPGLV